VTLRRGRFGLALFAVCLALVSAPRAFAGIGFQPISPDELKMTSEAQAPGAPAIILYRQVDRDDSGRTAHEDNYYRIKILTPEGRKYADIEIPFFKENGNNVVNVKARTVRPDGTIVNFDGKVFEKSIAKAKGLKYMAKTFTLPEVQVGCIIEYFYTIDLSEHYVYDSHWILSDELFTRSAKFSLKPYASSYSPLSVRWVWKSLPAGTEPPKEGPDHIVRLEARNIPAFEVEDFMPPANELKARVDFTYRDDFAENDPARFWKKHGKAMNDAVDSFINKRKAMEQAVAQIISAGDSAETKLQKIYSRVQEFRNTSYLPRKSEQELKREKDKDASNVEEVWKRGYGNGLELNRLFLALVRAAGLEAYSVRASDRRNYFFNPNLMDPTKLDADLILVKVDGKEMFFDPGAAFTPFGLLEWEETLVAGLRLDKNGGEWITTMLPHCSASRIERKADLTLADTGDLEGKLTISYTGLESMSRRREERNQDDADRKKYLEDEAKEYIPVASELELTNQPEWNNSSTPLVAEFHLKIPGWVSGAGRRAMLPVGVFSASEKHVFDHAQRVHPIYFQYPSEKNDDITIALPLGWAVSSLPAEQNRDANSARYLLKVENDKGNLHLTRKLSIDLVLLEAKYYPVLRNFFQVVRTGDEEQVLLQPIGTTAGK
jgi:uncharacterized protein DUF3857